MKKTFKVIVGIVALSSLLTFLNGCGSATPTKETSTIKASSATQSGTTGTETKGPVKIQLWMNSPGLVETQMIEVLSKFNKANDGKIYVNWSFIPRGGDFGYENKITAAVASGTLPDILKMDGPNVSNYAFSGIIQPMDKYFTKDDLADFVDSIIQQGTYDGKLYSLGETESNVAIYYNKKLFEAAGIVAPEKLADAWTWDQFYEAAKKLTKDGVYGANMCFNYGVGEWFTYFATPFLWSNGGDLVSADGMTATGIFNSAKNIEAVKFLQKMATDKLVNITPGPTEFVDGKAAMTMTGTWMTATMAKYPDMKWGITYFPRANNGKVVSPSGDWTWGISAKTQYATESAQLIKWITNKDNTAILSKAYGKPPARKSVFESMTEYNSLPLSIIKDQVINTTHARPRIAAYPVVTQQFATTLSDIIKGADAKEALDKATEKIQSEIDRNYKKK